MDEQKRNLPANPEWERDLDRLGMHWTGSTADKVAATEIVISMCYSWPLRNSQLERLRAISDWQQELAMEMLKRLDRFDPERVSDYAKDGTPTPNKLKKYLLKNIEQAKSTSLKRALILNGLPVPKEDKEQTDKDAPKPKPDIKFQFISLDAEIQDSDGDSRSKGEQIADTRLQSNDSRMMYIDALDEVAARFVSVAAVVLRFRSDRDARHQVMQRFMPICYSEHLTFAVRQDTTRGMLESQSLRRYKKDMLHSLDWNYLRYIADDLPEEASLEALYDTELKLESQLLPDGRSNYRLRFIGEPDICEDGEYKDKKAKSASAASEDEEPAASKMPFFLKSRLVSLNYYKDTYHTNSTPTLVRQERILYVESIGHLLTV